MNWKLVSILLALSAAMLVAQTPPATILELDIENLVFYYNDVSDPAKMASSATPVTPASGRTFREQIALGDIVAINGRPAKGLWAARCTPLQFSSTQRTGQAIADVDGFGMNDWHFVILQPDGTPVGTLMALGVGGMTPPPGSPSGASAHNLTIAGGTGAFLGARGQYALKETSASRAASMAEDPAYRRINGGGGKRRDIIHLIPATWPQVLSLPSGPSVFHSADFSPVRAEKPAKPGEQLIMSVSGLGPVKPALDPGKPFPPLAGKVYMVNSPIEITVNGKAAEVVNALGWPETNNVYRVDFRVPEGTAEGIASVGISGAWINGNEVGIPVRK